VRAAARRTLAWAAAAGLSCASLQAGSPPKTDERGRLRFSLDGGFVPGTRTFSGTRTFTEFAEQGRIESQYKEDAGPGFEAALACRFGRRLGVSAAVSLHRRDEGGTFAAELPHPLYFGASRRVTGDFGGGSQRETAVHLDLVFLGGSPRRQWSAFAGPSLIAVKADLLQQVEYTQAYPFDTVTVTGTPLAVSRGRAVGFNLGAGLDWHMARHVAIGTQVRFSRATVGLDPTAEDRASVDAGGVHLSGGIRFDF
jgi:opacity protein-like surface antigen